MLEAFRSNIRRTNSSLTDAEEKNTTYRFLSPLSKGVELMIDIDFFFPGYYWTYWVKSASAWVSYIKSLHSDHSKVLLEPKIVPLLCFSLLFWHVLAQTLHQNNIIRFKCYWPFTQSRASPSSHRYGSVFVVMKWILTDVWMCDFCIPVYQI